MVNLYREAVFRGTEVVKDEWPFMAALYYSRTFKYFCGGTIISRRTCAHRITKMLFPAAHCVQTKGKLVQLTPDEIIVRLGAYNLTDRNEKDAVDRIVAQIYVHPDWKYNDEKYDADITILVLNENLTFSDHIRPVCMPPENFLIDGLLGTVVGWGKTENGTAEGIPKKIEVDALNDTYCYEMDEGIASYASERSFCGVGTGSPNSGDSGGGFFAVAGSGWVQFGTVSFIRPKGSINNLNVALYMKLTSLRDWIAERVEESGGTIGLATVKTDLNCFFASTVQAYYGCWLYELNVRQENFVVEKFTGSHDIDRKNDDVEMIVFATGVMASLPLNFGKIFRNLKQLVISVSTTRIFRTNLENLESLERIFISNCSISKLDENSLWDLPNLQSFEVKNSKLKLLHAVTFSRNYELERVVALSNGLKSLPANLFRNNSQLGSVAFDDNLIESIDENIFETNANLLQVSLKGNRLRHLKQNLFRNNLELRLIDLSNNHIKTIDDECFTTKSNLISLNLASNELEFLPEQLLQGAESLGAIFLNDNVLKAIDEQMFATNVRLTTIKMESNRLLSWLDISGNFIGAIDENLFKRNSLLRSLSLEDNLIVEFPRNLFRHNSLLEIVSVGYNVPEKIDENLFQWNPRLRYIVCRNNLMGSLSGQFFQNNSLLEVIVCGVNSIHVIDEHAFRNNVNLREVRLGANQLTSIPKHLFRNNLLLEIVDFHSNLFTSLSENIFRHNANLEKVYLQNCHLERVPVNLFQRNTRLKYIDLSNNKLQFIGTDFSKLKHLSFIDLSKNVCIDATCAYNGESYTYITGNQTARTNNIAEFQDLVVGASQPKHQWSDRWRSIDDMRPLEVPVEIKKWSGLLNYVQLFPVLWTMDFPAFAF
ncbi:hypothetical protein HA402_004081 [Bradysia odoriphaga]|nr:hypothetical protein HA402_004081 [Bradysia odoriphaga]